MSDSQHPGHSPQATQVKPPATPERQRKTRNVIAWFAHLIHDRMMPNLREFMSERQLLVWLVALVIGIGAAYFAILFRTLIGLFQLPWLRTTSENVYTAAAQVPWWIILLAPAVGGLLVGLFLQYVMPGRRPQGVADVMESRALLGCRIPAQVGLRSAFISALSLGTGASAGREGPMVHLGATLASVLVDLFKFSHAARRTLLACGVAAAVSASFNAPIAGVLFAHEVILAHYGLRAFVPIVISSVAATVIARNHLGGFPAFIIPDYSITSYWEFPAFALLGLTCAAVAIAFQFAIVASHRVADSVDVPLWTRPVIGGLMIGGIAIWFPQVLGVGYDATDAALKHQFPLYLLLVLLVLKTIATAITLASRFGGGVFSPSLYLGAMAGGAFGIIAASIFPSVASSEGLYAIVGMGAVAAAVLGAPISTTLIVFELTGGYEMTIALLLAISVSTGLTQAVHGQSFFHYLLSTRGVFLKDGPHKQIVRSLKVREFMLSSEQHVSERLEDFAEDVAWLTPDDTVEAALRAFDRTGHNRLPVVGSSDTSKLIGWAEHLDALNAFNAALIEASEEEHK
jgi:CIC family chloride channel protein